MKSTYLAKLVGVYKKAISLEERRNIIFTSRQKLYYRNYFKEKYESSLYIYIITSIENAYEQLDNISKMILYNDFFFQDYKFWAIASFQNDKAYRRAKAKAITSFMFHLRKCCYENI